MNRQKRALVVVGLAVLLASLASYGVYRAIQQIPVREVQVATAFAVVAKDRLPVGTMVTAQQVQLVPWPEASPVQGGFSKIEDVVGRGVISEIVPNEPLTELKVAAAGAGGGLPPMIPAGMRAMSVKVNDVTAVAGFTQPSTRVDVLVTVRNNNESMTRAVVSNVQVLAANTRMDQEKAREGQAIPTTVVTLLVTPQDAERIALAQTDGQIMLALRNPLDVDPTQTNGVRMSALMASPNQAPVRQVVQGRPRMVTPPPPPPPPAPYTVEAIRGAKRSEEVVR
jgi:pilus assembly protein CpaB